MNNFRLQVEFISRGNAKIATIELPPITNNASGKVENLSQMSKGKKMCWLSSTKTNGKIVLAKKNAYPGIVFDGNSGNDGETNIPITVTGENIRNLSLIFDETNGEFATEIDVDGVTYSNEIKFFIATYPTAVESSTVTIKKWSKANVPVKLTSILLGWSMEFDKSYIKSLAVSSVLLENETQPNYGISVQSGNVKMQDLNGELKSMAESEVLKDGLEFRILFNGELISVLTSKDVEYNTSTNFVSINLVDTIEKLQNNVINSIDLPSTVGAEVPMTAIELLSKISKEKFEMDEETKTHLQKISLAIPYIKVQKEYDALLKFCQMAQCRIYKTRAGVQRIKKI